MKTTFGKLLPCALAAFALSTAFAPAATAQKIGEKQTLSAQYGSSANWNDTDTNTTVIQIEPGWAIVSNGLRDARSSNYGRTSLNVSYVAANGHFASSSEMSSQFRSKIDQLIEFSQREGLSAAQKEQAYKAIADLKEERQKWESARESISSSHSAVRIVTKATGSGNTIDRKGASIQGTYNVTVRYVGTKNELTTLLARYKPGSSPPSPTPSSEMIAYQITNDTRYAVTLTFTPTKNTRKLAPGETASAKSPVRNGQYPKVNAKTSGGASWTRTISQNNGRYRVVNRGSGSIQIVP
jgi:hypothetical protein